MNLPEIRPLTLGSVLAALAFQLDESLEWQVIDPARPDTGARIAHDTGLSDASHTATVPLLVGCAYLSLAHARGQAPCPPMPPHYWIGQRWRQTIYCAPSEPVG
jgi:hypothetical protein